IFEKKDWLNFFKISLSVGFIVIFYAFLQYFGVKNFPFLLISEERPISFIGNPAFLATHMFFTIIFAIVVFFETIGKTFKLLNFETFKLLFWRYFSLLIIPLSAITIFLTATRGAIVGLVAGILFLLIYFAIKKSSNFEMFKFLNIRNLSIILLGLIVTFSAIFWITRQNQVWQKIPGLNRLAQTAAMDKSDPSTQFRLITWKLSWNAFKEKPLFGWGPENYIVAYEKYYNPEYAVYGETWLDRAHNKVIDVVVMQGIFGLLVYLGIFGVIFYSLFKLKEPAAPFLMAGLIGYFVQNLFVFDQVISYSTFFAVLGFLIYLKPLNFETLKNPAPFPKRAGATGQAFKLFIIIVFIVGIGYSLYFYNLVPYVQARLFKASPGISKDINAVADYLKKSMYPYNFAQFNIRGSGIDTIYMDQFFYRIEYVNNPKFRPLGDLLIAGMDEVAGREPYDIRVLIREVEMLNGYTRVMDEKEAAPLFEKAEKLMREAVKRAPNRQEVYYHLAFNLAGQKRYEEAIEVAKYAISLNPKVARAHFHLALVSTIAGKNKEALEALAEVDKLDPDLKTLMSGDKDTTLLIYNANGRLDKVAELITESLNRGESRAFDRKYYEAALRYYALKTDAQNFIKVANYLKQFEDLKEDMEVLIDLAEKGLWNIIHSL
ncbi:MAG: O-antigen ligase family protein, partial [Patescibacteria group bacterium]|nr:O-antigen ligase family protein [Patescibacteria group bacterium]